MLVSILFWAFSAVLVGAKAVLIRGPSGSGKSRLAFALLQAAQAGQLPFARLVADDRALVEAVNGRLLVRPAPVLHEVDALPSPERELARDNGHLQRDTIEHRLNMSRHVVGPFDVVDPRCVLRRKPVECGNQVGLDVGICVFLNRQ